MAMQVITSAERYHADHGWLSTRHHFSFNDYFDPDNVSFSALRVFNDDVVQPKSGFPPHAHRDMEIITYVVEGELEHRDNQGNRGRILAGEVQVMSAGTGIVHAESNPSPTERLHLYQIWILPRTRGQAPRWEQQRFTKDARAGTLLAAVTPAGGVPPGPSRLQIDQDASIHVASLEAGKSVTHAPRRGRRCYLFVIAGSLDVNGTRLDEGDQARITETPPLTLAARAPAELILIDLP